MKKLHLLELLTVTLLIVVFVVGLRPARVLAAEWLCVESEEELDALGRPVIEELVVTGSSITLSGVDFRGREIRRLHYDVPDMEDLSDTPFAEAKIGCLTIGEHVERIPAGLFRNARLFEGCEEEHPSLTVNCSVGERAFFNAFRGNAVQLVIGGSGAPIRIEAHAFQGLESCALDSLRIGANVVEIEDQAFANLSIGLLEYGAVDIGDSDEVSGSPFRLSVIGSLRFLHGVRVIRTNLFFGVELQQEELVIPESVEWMGQSVFQETIGRSIEIQSLVFEAGDADHVLYLSPDTFVRAGDEIYHLASVRMEVVRAADGWADDVEGWDDLFPACERLYVHHESEFAEYFRVDDAESVCWLCEEADAVTGEDHMRLASSTEVRDEVLRLVRTTEVWRCELCGYEHEVTRDEEIEDEGEAEGEAESEDELLPESQDAPVPAPPVPSVPGVLPVVEVPDDSGDHDEVLVVPVVVPVVEAPVEDESIAELPIEPVLEGENEEIEEVDEPEIEDSDEEVSEELVEESEDEQADDLDESDGSCIVVF